jgi:hypothetical protein
LQKSGSSGYMLRSNGGSGMKKEYVKPTLAKREQLAKVSALVSVNSGNLNGS